MAARFPASWVTRAGLIQASVCADVIAWSTSSPVGGEGIEPPARSGPRLQRGVGPADLIGTAQNEKAAGFPRRPLQLPLSRAASRLVAFLSAARVHNHDLDCARAASKTGPRRTHESPPSACCWSRSSLSWRLICSCCPSRILAGLQLQPLQSDDSGHSCQPWK